MSNLGETYVAQAKSFLGAGDLPRGIDLLERARKLSENNPELLAEILAELSTAYEWAGNIEESKKCEDELRTLTPPMMSALVPPPGRRLRQSPLTVAAVMLGILCGAGAITFVMWNPAIQPVVQSRGVRLHDNVGLLVYMAEYKGSAKGRPLVLDVPLGSATCFAISKDGDLLTDRDIWDTDPPTTLPLPLTGMYLVKHYYVACFGPKEADRFDATLLGVSPRIDLAAFRVDHHFLEPFRFADPPTKLGDEVYAAGFPGEILNFLDDANGSTTSEKEQLGQALNSDSGRADLLDAYFLNWSYSLLNKGMVSAIGHIIDDVDYTEFDIQVSQGENGGPLLNTQFQIAGMVTFNKTDPSDTSPPTGRAISSWELQRAVSTLIPGQIR